ncbi:hypothetical protein TNCV_4097121 [Trichonephila clavipes]|nr:hypothetical protein TNCV_4097121 [Trichonephila clavipes]
MCLTAYRVVEQIPENSRRAASPLVMLVELEERWEALDHPQGVLPQYWGETQLNMSTCLVLRVTTSVT